MDSRGQSALEYLMTYGWALVVIVIAVAALVVLINGGDVKEYSAPSNDVSTSDDSWLGDGVTRHYYPQWDVTCYTIYSKGISCIEGKS